MLKLNTPLNIAAVALLLISYHKSLAQKNKPIHVSSNLGCTYYFRPTYIINSNYVIYEDCKTRKIFYPDIASFKTLFGENWPKFAFDKKGIYFEGQLITKDTTGFKILSADNFQSHIFWKNRSKAFNNKTPLKHVDVPSFETVYSYPYFKDKNSLYYITKKIPQADVKSITREWYNIYDKNFVYDADTPMVYHNKVLKSVNTIIAKTDSEVVLLNYIKKALPKFDAKSLVGLSPNYSADRFHIYYDTITLATTAQIDIAKIKVWQGGGLAFLFDGHQFYCRNSPIETTADPNTFAISPNMASLYDKNGIYYLNWIKDIQKYVLIKYPFIYKSDVTIENFFSTYFGTIYENQVLGRKGILHTDLSNADINKLKSVRYINRQTTVDEFLHNNVKNLNNLTVMNNQVFYGDSLIKNIDGRFLSFIGNNYYKIKNNVYHFYNGVFTLMSNADATTFKTTRHLNYDKKFVFVGTTPILKSKNIEVVGILSGNQTGGDEGMIYHSYFLYRNSEGFWVRSTETSKVQYIGKTLNKKLINLPKDFVLAKSKK